MIQATELRGAVLGKGYRLGRPLGDGGHAVFEVTHERVHGRYVVRLFPDELLAKPEASSRIQRGARLASLLRDPYAVQVVDFSVSGEAPAFTVMEKVEGRSLATVMAEDGMLPLANVLDLVEALAVILDTGHRLGLVHGDLRPAHVFLPSGVAGAPMIKLAGFGWAKELRAAAKRPTPTGYLAPEQQYGKALNLDARVDQFALATLAYEMIAGCLPFSEESADLAQQRGGRRAAPPSVAELVPGVPAALDGVLRQALATEPRDRFANIVDLGARLRRASGGTGAYRPLSSAPVPAPLAAALPQPISDITEELDLDTMSSVDDELGGGVSAIEELDPELSAAAGSEKTQIKASPFLNEDDGTVDRLLQEDIASGEKRRSRSSGLSRSRSSWSAPTASPVVLSGSVAGAAEGPVVLARQGGHRMTFIFGALAALALVVAAIAFMSRSRRATGPTTPALTAPVPAPGSSAPQGPGGNAEPAAAPGTAAPAAVAGHADAAAAAPAGATPPGAQPPTGPLIAQVEPLPPTANGPGSGAPSGRSPAASVRSRPASRPAASARSATAPAAETAAATPDRDQCPVQIFSKPWAQVWIDGKNTGRKTPVTGLKLPCGARKLQLKRPDRDLEQMEIIILEAGRTFRGSYDLE
jgi:serine/threonine protein kinase